MTEINTHQEDLLFLTRNVRGALQNLASTVPKPSKDKQAVDSSAKQCLKNIELLSGNIQNLMKYSKHLLSFGDGCQKKRHQSKLQLCKVHEEIAQASCRNLSLEEQSMQLRKKLNEKDKEIQKLKMIRPINVSFTQSIYFNDEDEAQRNEQIQNSQNSFTITDDLDSYDSSIDTDEISRKNGRETRGQNFLQDQIKILPNSIICAPGQNLGSSLEAH